MAMSCISDDQSDERHDARARGQLGRQRGRLGAWPELPSPGSAADNGKRNGPAVVQVLAIPGTGPGRHHTVSNEGADMAKRTRTLRRPNKMAGSGVKITPPWSTANTTTSL